MILLTLIARLKDSLILVSSSKAADEADPNVEKYTRQAEMMLRTLNAPGTSAVRSFKSEPYLFHYVIKGSICALSVCEEKFARNTTFAFLTDIAKAFLKQNGARVDVVATPYYFFEFDKYIEGAKRKHAVQAVNTKPQDLSRTTVSNTKKVVQRVHLLITARQVASVLAQKKTVVIIDYRTSKPNYIQCKCEHLRLLFIDASYISTRSDLSALLNQTTEPDKTVLRSLGDYYMVVLMGDDEEQHHESIMDYHKKSKPRMLFDILHKDNMDGTRPKRVLMLSDGFPGWIGAFPNYVSNSKYIHWKDAPIPPAPDVFSLLDVRPKPKTEQAWLVELKAAANAARNGTTASRAITPARPPKPTKEPAPKAPKTTASADAPAPPSSSPPPDQPSAHESTYVAATATGSSSATAERSMKRKSPEAVSTMDTKPKPTAPTTCAKTTRASRKGASAAQQPPLSAATDAKVQKSLRKRAATPDDLAVSLSHATLDSPDGKGTSAKGADESGRATPEQPTSSGESDGVPRGLHNFGLTCYANALLQAMFHAGEEFCDAARAYLQQLKDEEQTKGLVLASLPVTRAFLRIQKDRFKDDDTFQAKWLEKFLEKVRELSVVRFPREGGFPSHKQHDPHELFLQLMDFMQRELTVTVREVLHEEPLTPDHTDRFFKHTLVKAYTCTSEGCGYTETKPVDDNHFIMTLANTDQETTASLLRRTIFDADTALDADPALDAENGKKKCRDCGTDVPASRPLGFQLRPPVLILNVKRYLDVGGDKLTESVRPSHHIAVGTADPTPLPARRGAAPQASLSLDGSPPRKSPRKDDDATSAGAHASADLNASANTTGPLEAEEIPGDEFHAYNPVDHTWRAEWCRTLLRRDYNRDVDALRDPYEVYNFNVDRQQFWYYNDEEPAHRVDVEGDGNCLFRSFSHLLTCCEDYHKEIRSAICDFMEEHTDTFKELYLAKEKQDETEFADYLRKMREDATWGTELEMFVFATLTQTPVAAFHEGRWHVHQPRFKLVDGVKQEWAPSPDQKTVFVHNDGNVHFSPVVCVPTKQLYEIRAVVNHLGEKTNSGHYVAYLRMKSGKWVLCDDSAVTAVDDPANVLRDCASDGYLYLYAKSDATPSTFGRTSSVPAKSSSSSRSAFFG